MPVFVFCNLMWLLAGFIAGITSFGGNLVAVPFITLVIAPKDAILAGCISGTAVFAALALIYRNSIIWRETILLTIGAIFGIPFGIWFLASAGASAILMAAGCSLILFLAWQFASGLLRKATKSISCRFAPIFGLVSGIMMAAVGMGGPPLVLYIYLRRLGKEETLGTVNAASVAFMFLVLPWQYFAGLYDGQNALLGVAGAVFAICGIAASIPVVKRINLGLFRMLLLAMLSLSAIVLLARAF